MAKIIRAPNMAKQTKPPKAKSMGKAMKAQGKGANSGKFK